MMVKDVLSLLEEVCFYEWIANLSPRLETGAHFTFEDHEYLLPLYKDEHRDIVFQKASQVCISTYGIFDCLFRVMEYGNTAIFYQPTATHVFEFSKTRFAPIIEGNPYIRKSIEKNMIESASARQIGKGQLFCRGLTTGLAAKSVPADMIVIDELDEVENPEIITETRERTFHSKYKIFRKYSRPSFPGYGINAFFLESDQRFWLVKCPGCSSWRDLVHDFTEKNVDLIPGDLPICLKCGRELTKEDVRNGLFVPKKPDITDVRGYQISQINAPFVDYSEIKREFVKAKKRGKQESFFRGTIGIPYIDAYKNVTVDKVMACRADLEEPDHWKHTYVMGIDQGDDIHGVVGFFDKEKGKNRIVDIFLLDDFEDIDAQIKRWNIGVVVIDANPNKHPARKLSERFEGKVYLHYYNDNLKSSEFVFYTPGQQKRNQTQRANHFMAESNRVEIADETTEDIMSQQVILPGKNRYIETFAQHFENLVKQEFENAHGRIRMKYISIGADHWRHAYHYFRVGLFKSVASRPCRIVGGKRKPFKLI